MKKFFLKIKNKISFFFLESQKPFFIVFFAVIFLLAVFSFTQAFILYDESGVFFKNTEERDFNLISEIEKIDIVFKDEGRMVIKKTDSVSLDFNEISFSDLYYTGEYKIIFPEDYGKCFEKDFFDVKNNFINFVSVSADETGHTVLTVKEKDIFAPEISKGKNELTLFFKEPEDVYDKIIVLDPGHGGMDFGVNNGSNMEKDITLKICHDIERMFERNDSVKVYLTRNYDEYIKDEERVFFANEYGDLYVSVHLSAKDQYTYSDGTEIVYHDEDTESGTFLENCANDIKDNIIKYMALEDAEALNRYMEETKGLKIPSVVCKLGYSDKYANDEDFSSKAALGIYEGLNEALTEFTSR